MRRATQAHLKRWRGWRRRHHVVAFITIPLGIAAAIGAALAFWGASSVPGGNGGAALAVVNRGAAPTSSATGSTVTVTWAATTLSSGDPVSGYVVTRYDVATVTAQTMLSACAGTVTAITCTEGNVPTGQWVYSVTPVFAANWRGLESITSNAVTTDATAPANAVTLNVLTGSAAKTGNTIYYRGAAAGSFKLSNAVTDVGSGPASSATAALGGTTTGWTHTPSTVSTPASGPYLSNAFSWAAATTSSPTEPVTGRDVAGNTTTTGLTFVNDGAGPTGGALSYLDGVQPGRSITVTLTSAADGGAGLESQQLQRSFAALTSGACGTFSAFANLGQANPTTPYVDNQVTNGVCYKYRYVATDALGNQTTATSANVAKVDYSGAVAGTTGLLSLWRFGETPLSSDSFTDPTGTVLSNETPEVGTSWSRWVNDTITAYTTGANRLRKDNVGGGVGYYTAATPASADYKVEADVVVQSIATADHIGVIGRWDITATTGAGTYYNARYETATNAWQLIKVVNGTGTSLGSFTQTLTGGATYRLGLDMSGSTIRLLVDGVQRISSTDASITGPGRAGVRLGAVGDTAPQGETTGLQLDNFQVTPGTGLRAADSKGSNTGDYVNGPLLGAAGALAGDSNTAALFDGVNDYVQAVSTTGIPVGASLRSVEMWFKTTSTSRGVLFTYGSRTANGGEFGLWVSGSGTTMTAWGIGAGFDKDFTMPYAVNDGAWHQVVQTYNGTSLTLFIDGVALPSQAAVRNTVMDAYGFQIGAVVVPGDSNSGGYFKGALDEVSLYTTVLSQATVSNHYQLGTSPAADLTGPTGGSVDVTGLVGTGNRYSTSTTLNLAFNKGTDPSGLATTGAQLLRASATLTSSNGIVNGVCGTFGAYSVVGGGNDPASPSTDTVADQACYSYQYVVSDTVGNTTTYTSPAVKVDTSPPVITGFTISAMTNAYWSGGASTLIYYRPSVSGSLTTTVTASDPASGIASFAFPNLGAGWTSTAGSLGVHVYTWTPNPANPGTSTLTVTSNASGVTSGAATEIPDSTPPAASTVSYANGTQSSTSVVVSTTTGSDGSGSGIGTRLLQRASATLQPDGTCGAFGGFATVTGGTNPTTPFTDTVARGSCSMYQYVVLDNVGNSTTAGSANVVKVSLSYANTVLTAPGLVDFWRLGESTTSSDSLTGPASSTLQTHVGEIGASWTKNTAMSTSDAVLTPAGRIRKAGTSTRAIYYTSAVSTSADYIVEADVYVASVLPDDAVGVIGRVDTGISNGTYYAASYDKVAGAWVLYSMVAGTKTVLGQSTQALTAGSTYRLTLDMTGTTIRLLVNGTQQVSVVNGAITSTGRGGVALGTGSTSTTDTDSTGMHLDNFLMMPPAADSKGTAAGDFIGGPLLGIVGAISGDASTAVSFDGNDFASVPRTIADDFSIEFWFKSTQGIGTGGQWWQAAGLVDGEVNGAFGDFGVTLRSDGRVVAGVGTPDVSVVSSTAGFNDGGWHHVVFTRAKLTGALALYVDGVPMGTATGSTLSLTSSPIVAFGSLATGGNRLVGSIDEVSMYNIAMSSSAVAAHYAASQ